MEKKKFGRVINTSSIGVKFGGGEKTYLYSLSKHINEFIPSYIRKLSNKNILYKKNGEERYPNFKLYKMIARTVHNKTPDDQLNTDIFKQPSCNILVKPNIPRMRRS